MHGSSVRDTGEALRRAQIRGWLNEPLSVQVALVNSHTDGHAFEESVGDFNGPSTGKANQRSHRQRMASWCQSRVRQTGAAAVEFALILPVLLAVLIGSVDVSLALYDKAVITNASREGARAGIVARNPKLRDDEIRLLVRGYTDGEFITNDPGTKHGEDFRYSESRLLGAAHDWNGGDVPHGAPVMLIVRPR